MFFCRYCEINQTFALQLLKLFLSTSTFYYISFSLYESVAPVEDSTVKEVACVLREWHVIWKRLYVVSI